MLRHHIGIVFLIQALFLASSAALAAAPETSPCIRVLFVEQTLIQNNSNSTVNVTSTPMLLYFDYPQDIGGQRVLETLVWWNGKPANYSLRRSSDGDLSLRVRPLSLHIAPGSMLNITVAYIVELNSTERTLWQPGLKPEEALGASSLWNYTNPLLAAASLSLSQSTSSPRAYLYRVLEWMDSNVAYMSRIPARHPWEVIEERRGDCDDRSNLLVAMLRARGIPAYTEFGFIVIPGYVAEGSAADGHFNYKIINGGPHGWVMVYLEGRWIAVDTTFYRNVTGKPSDHIEYAAYSTESLAIMVTGWTLKTDYVSRDTSTLSRLSSSPLTINDTVEARVLGVCEG